MITTYNLVFEALKPIYEFVKDPETEFGDAYSNGPYKRTTNLRLDAECIATRTESQMTWLAFTQFRDDIMDLVTNGDINKHSDALLKFLDGEVKRGKRLKQIHFSRAQCHREFKPKHNAYEYTLYVVVYVEYE